MITRISGLIFIVIGSVYLLMGLFSVLQKWGHNLSASIYHGIYIIIAGIGLIMLKKWGVIMAIIPIAVYAFLDIRLAITDKPASPGSLIAMALVSFVIVGVLLSQWKSCSWK